MEIKSTFFPQYLNERVVNIPSHILQELVDEFAINAKFYMSADVDGDTTDKINSAVMGMLKSRYSQLPLNLVSEAYSRGSLGELGGTTRFTPRTIAAWLTNIEEKNNILNQTYATRLNSEQRIREEREFMANKKRNNLFGLALSLKVSWLQGNRNTPLIGKVVVPTTFSRFAGKWNPSDKEWDRCSLDKIVALIEMGIPAAEINPKAII
jgi:hypothetical protein